jgi:hypothetical protein
MPNPAPLRRRFRIADVELKSFSTDFTLCVLDDPNPAILMSPAGMLHHLGVLVGREFAASKGLEFTVEITDSAPVQGPAPVRLLDKLHALDVWSEGDCGCDQLSCVTCVAWQGYVWAAEIIQETYRRCLALGAKTQEPPHAAQ